MSAYRPVTGIGSASVDPSGLAISEVMRGDIRSLGQAYRNANEGVSFLQVAEGGLNTIGNMARRLKELALQAATDTLSNREREFLDLEFQNLTQEIERVVQGTNFNGVKALDGRSRKFDIQIGIDHNAQRSRVSYDVSNILKHSKDLAVMKSSVHNRENARDTIGKIDSFINELSRGRGYLGGLQNRFESTAQAISIMNEGMQSAHSQVRDTDVAKSAGLKTKFDIMAEAGSAVLAQANNIPKDIERLIS